MSKVIDNHRKLEKYKRVIEGRNGGAEERSHVEMVTGAQDEQRYNAVIKQMRMAGEEVVYDELKIPNKQGSKERDITTDCEDMIYDLCSSLPRILLAARGGGISIEDPILSLQSSISKIVQSVQTNSKGLCVHDGRVEGDINQAEFMDKIVSAMKQKITDLGLDLPERGAAHR